MTVSLCIRQGSKRNDDSVSVEELDWSAGRQLNTSGVPLNADLETKTHHMIQVHELCFHLCCHRLKVTFSLLKKGLSQYFCPYNECTSHWCLEASRGHISLKR